MASQHQIDTITVDAISWTAVAPSIDCDYMILENTSASVNVLRRIASGSSATERTLGPGAQWESLPAPRGLTRSGRFLAGTTLFFCQAASGTVDLKLEQIR